LTARSTSWPRWSSLTCPRERSERSTPPMGRWAYLSVHRRRPAGLQVGRHAQRR
jgi:hypothetical protein